MQCGVIEVFLLAHAKILALHKVFVFSLVFTLSLSLQSIEFWEIHFNHPYQWWKKYCWFLCAVISAVCVWSITLSEAVVIGTLQWESKIWPRHKFWPCVLFP